MKISGIYKIQSKAKPERIYIGSAVWIGHRWDQHLYDLRKNEHDNNRLQNHFNKYGESDLSFSILLGCEKEYLIANEQFFIDSYKPYFNIRLYANSQLGFRHTKESKQKMSESRKGVKLSEEHRLNVSKSLMGKGRSEETKIKIGNGNRGKKRSEEQNKRNGDLKRGGKLSEEHKQKISNSNKGKSKPEGFGLKIKEVWRLRKLNKSA